MGWRKGRRMIEVAQAPNDRGQYLSAVTALLREVFNDERYVDAYIQWLYDQNPEGHEVAAELLDNERMLAHYAIVPRRYVHEEKTLRFGLSLNTAVSEAARGKGVFTRLAEETYEKARSQGLSAIIGVANGNSTHGFLNKLQFRHVCGLPVVVGACLPRRRGDSFAITTGSVDVAALRDATQGVRWSSASAKWQPHWNVDSLAWRLSGTASRYSVHQCASGVAIATKTFQRGVPFVALLKFFGRRDQVLAPGELVAEACAFYRTPFVVYSGLSSSVHIRGLPLPRRLRPSPLNLIYRKLANPAPDAQDFSVDGFEFLDFDAY